MVKTTKDKVIQRLRNMERPYKTGFEPAPHLRKDIADVLDSPDFRNLNELINKALDDWLREREHMKIKDRMIKTTEEKKEEDIQKAKDEILKEVLTKSKKELKKSLKDMNIKL